jgi:hypothetical protein
MPHYGTIAAAGGLEALVLRCTGACKGLECSLKELTEHGVCTHREACPRKGCREAYKMQPVDDPERLKTNPHPKWPVPEEVIEWQPSYVQRGETQTSFGSSNR